MKLKKLKVFIVGNQKPYWGGQYFIFVKLTSDNGIIGHGEVYAGSVSTKVMEYVIKDVFDRHMKNEAPENIELMFRRVYSSGFSQRPDPTVIGAFSGLEMACLDILGKSIDKPIYSILGGCMQNKIRSYTYLYPLEHHNKEKFWSSPDMAVESAKKNVRFRFYGFKV